MTINAHADRPPRRPPSDSAVAWTIAFLLALFIFFSDAAILVLSPNPHLFGILDANSTRFEETILYLPAIRNFSFIDPLLADFTGPRLVHALSPMPYVALALAKCLYYLAGGSLSGTVMAIHSLIIFEGVACFWLCRLYSQTAETAMLAALTIVFGNDLVSSAISISATTNLAIPVALTFLLVMAACHFTWRLGNWRVLVAFALIMPSSGFLCDYAVSRVTGSPLLSDVAATRYLSPLIPMCFLYCTLVVLLRADERLQGGAPVTRSLLLAVLLFAANLYVYFANWIILIPIFGIWLLLRHRLIMARVRVFAVIGAFGVLLTLPFAVILVHAKTFPPIKDYVFRAGSFGIETYHRFTYPPLSALWVNLAIVAVLAGLMTYHSRRGHYAFSFARTIPLTAYLISVVTAYANYAIGEVIPQPLLFHRYWVPLALLSLLVTTKPRWPILRPSVLALAEWSKIRHLMTGCFVAWLGILAVGRWNAHAYRSGPAVGPLAATAMAVSELADESDVLVSDWQPLVLLAPSYGVKTLCPDPILTVGTHQELIHYYATMNKILGRSTDQYLRFIGNVDRWGPTHEMSLSTDRTMTFASQHEGLAYPMPPHWLDAHSEQMAHEYESMQIEQVLSNLHGLLLCLKNELPQPAIADKLTDLGRAGLTRCWHYRGSAT